MIELVGMGSPNVEKVILMLEETGLPYRITRVDVFRGEHQADSFDALNPNRKVPVLIDPDGPDGVPLTIFESGAILLYLAEKTDSFLPADAAGRYAVLQWLMLQMASIGPVAGQAIHFSAVVTEPSYARGRFVRELDRLLDLIDRRLGAGAFVAGDSYSIADMAIFPWAATVGRMLGLGDARPNLVRWQQAIGARPAAVRTATVMDGLRKLDRASLRGASKEELDRYFGRSAIS